MELVRLFNTLSSSVSRRTEICHCSIVMSIFAIVILSVLGGMFKVSRLDLGIESILENI